MIAREPERLSYPGGTRGTSETGRVGAGVPCLQSDRAGDRNAEGTLAQTGTALATEFDRGTHAECATFLRHAGYGQSKRSPLWRQCGDPS